MTARYVMHARARLQCLRNQARLLRVAVTASPFVACDDLDELRRTGAIPRYSLELVHATDVQAQQPRDKAAETGRLLRKRHARRKAMGARAPILVEAKPNARWSTDFVHDQFANGRRFRILNIVDDVTKQFLGAIPDTSISGRRVARELAAIIERYGKPRVIVSDHGTEFTCNAMLA